jgi:primosomal protein N' (replication factor Y) (superfamily II helicase)
VLTLDREFTYRLDGDLGAGVGSLVQVTFHGRVARGWVLGPTDDVPGRLLPVRRALSPVRFFDETMLGLFRWMAERYVAPLATIVSRSHPPRVASEEGPALAVGSGGDGAGSPGGGPGGVVAGYRGGAALAAALADGAGAFVVRPAPRDEQRVAVEAVRLALAGGRSAIALVPEAEPLPATAAAIRDEFGDVVATFVGGSRRERYRTWLEIGAGRFRVVVGTRPAVFAPVPGLGLVWISRESHPGHREERSPAFHVRDVALARARLEHAVCALAALCPTGEAVATDAPVVAPAARAWPPVEVVRPGPEGRAPRLVRAVQEARRGFLYAPLPGYGIARVCRTCGEPARCAACGGTLRQEGGQIRCVVCEAPGRCAACGGRVFGLVRGGAERVEEWAGRVAQVPVMRSEPGDPGPPASDGILVGGPEAVKDVPPPSLDLVGVLDADLAARRPGLTAGERSLALWMEAGAWAAPGGRVIVQSSRPNDPAVQALVAGNPERFHRADRSRRERAGFPVGYPVFRVLGTGELEERLRELGPQTLLSSALGDQTVCLVTVRPDGLRDFGRAVRDLAVRGVVVRVEGEPHL